VINTGARPVQLHYIHHEKQKCQPENEHNICAAEMLASVNQQTFSRGMVEESTVRQCSAQHD
jgi:hypothetical protein